MVVRLLNQRQNAVPAYAAVHACHSLSQVNIVRSPYQVKVGTYDK